MRNFGVLIPVASLPSKYGIGSFGCESFDFIKFLHKNHLNVWQILPLNNTNETNCPYSSISSFTFDEMYVDIEALLKNRLISKKDLSILKSLRHSKKINYKKVKKEKLRLFEKAYSNLSLKRKTFIENLKNSRKDLFLYAYFRAILKHFKTDDWRKISSEYRDPLSSFGKEFAIKYADEINKHIFYQYTLESQWKKVLAFAERKNVQIWGDLPIYTPATSFEVFCAPQYFKLDKNYNPLVYGGVPGDEFCKKGQNWGTCIYNWNLLEKEKFSYLINRIEKALSFYHTLRLDHFIGLVEHYEIDAKDEKKNKWVKAGGEKLFNTLQKKISSSKLIVEDLGPVSKECIGVKRRFNLKGMAILQFAFDGNKKNIYLPANVEENTVYYLGNHDNNTFIGFLSSKNHKLAVAKAFGLLDDLPGEQLLSYCVKRMLESKSNTIILQMQDFLMQDASQRTNIPGVARGCWEYRCPENYKKDFQKNLKDFLR